jgi:hypothetical protein
MEGGWLFVVLAAENAVAFVGGGFGTGSSTSSLVHSCPFFHLL